MAIYPSVGLLTFEEEKKTPKTMVLFEKLRIMCGDGRVSAHESTDETAVLCLAHLIIALSVVLIASEIAKFWLGQTDCHAASGCVNRVYCPSPVAAPMLPRGFLNARRWASKGPSNGYEFVRG
jgi:hypothetical protein